MRLPPRKNKHPRGFSLIELLLAIAVGGMLIASMYAMLLGSVHTKRILENAIRINKTGPILLNTIRRDLEECYIPTLKEDNEEAFFKGEDLGDPNPDFSGGSARDTLNFVTTNNSALAEEGKRADYVEVGYELKENKSANGFYKLYRREEFFLQEDPLKDGKWIEMYDLVKSFDVKYLDPDKKEFDVEHDMAWEQEWEVKASKIKAPAVSPKGPGDGTKPATQPNDKSYKFPKAVKVSLIIGVRPEDPSIPPSEFKLAKFESVIFIPVGYRREIKKDNNQNPNDPNTPADPNTPTDPNNTGNPPK